MREESTRVDGPQIIREVVAGLAVGALEISVATSFAFLIFGGVLDDAVPRAIGLLVVGTGVAVLLFSRISKVAGLIGAIQDAPIVVIAAVVAALVQSVDTEVAEATAFAFILTVGVIVGLAFVIAGRYGITTTARSLPFTVITGFLAGTGWLLAQAGIEVAIDRSLDWASLADLFGWDQLKFWLPALAMAALVTFGDRIDRSGLLFPIAIVGLTLAVHIVGRLTMSLDEMRTAGWLLGPFPNAERWQPVTPGELADADWGAIFGEALPAAGLVGVALVTMVLNVAGLEMQTQTDIEMEDEVIRAGIGTTIISLLSGAPSFHQISGTAMVRQLGSRTPISAIVVFAMCLFVGFVSIDVIALLPRAVAGGVLLTVGLSMLRGWVGQVRHQLNPFEGAISAAILASVVAFGVLVGIVVGILVAILGFVFSYSRVEPIRRIHELGTTRSVVDRPRSDRRSLEENSEQLFAVELVGYLFFGSVRRVTDLVGPLLARGNLRYLIVDFSAVRGLDASAVSGLQTMQRRTTNAGVEMIWSGLDDAFATDLRRGGAEVSDHRYSDLDHALEYVEDRVLAEVVAPAGELHPLVPEEGDRVLLELLGEHCERLDLDANDTLVTVGDTFDAVFLIESGTLTAWGVGDRGGRTRYRRVGVGSVVGEIAFVTGGARTATVTADEPATVLRLSAEDYERLCAQEPDLALRVQRELSKRIAERLAYTSAAYQRAID